MVGVLEGAYDEVFNESNERIASLTIRRSTLADLKNENIPQESQTSSYDTFWLYKENRPDETERLFVACHVAKECA